MSYEDVTVVTEPDLFFANQPSILLLGCDDYLHTIIDNLRRLNFPVTVYTTSESNTLDWIVSAYNDSQFTILNCSFNDFYTGFFIDNNNVFYYNNKESYKRFNLNKINDPIEALIKWMYKWQKNQDLNVASL